MGFPAIYWALRRYRILIPQRELYGTPGLALGYLAGCACAALLAP